MLVYNRLFPKLYYALLLAMIFVGCERMTETIPPVSYDYYPLIEGKYKIYQIDSTTYDEYNCTVQTTSYQLKEVTGVQGTDGEGDVYYKLERYIRANATQPWTLQNVGTEKVENNELQRVVDNQRIINMVFPLKENTSWDGITYIRRDTLVPIRGGAIDMYKDWDDFVCTNIGTTFLDTASNVIYPDAAQIEQVDKVNNIERRASKEVYANGIGLVFKYMEILDTQCRVGCTGVGNIADCIATPWRLKAEKGFILTQTLIDHNY